jgi:alkanesulfonate monooxygenase SsuD/methylene tetrahydromethanopterin reductase-like flavin-dependent oxidoreductase (luciferase family)
MTKMVGRVADGMITHPTNTAPEYIRQVCLPRLQAGFAQAGRDGSDFKLVLGPLVATGPDEATVAAEWEKQRSMLGFLYSTPAYWPSLELFGWQQTGQHLLDLTRAGDWQRMSEVLTDEMLDKCVPRGTYENIAGEMRRRYGELAHRITFPMPQDPAQDDLAAEAIARLKA